MNSDEVLDVKVLPNRSHDCLSHRGIAREISLLTGVALKKEKYTENFLSKSEKLGVSIAKEAFCNRSTSTIMRGITVGPSPQWLVDRLQAVGQKSINNIVDATNYVMLSSGQPLHAFDLGKLIEKNGGYNILIRNAKNGENVVTLDDKTYTLSSDMLCITDGNCKDNKILDIAGIKGGKHAKISPETVDILIEAANFDAISIGKTARILGLRTDASMRFEHGITPEFTLPAMHAVCELIVNIAGGAVETFVDTYPSPQKKRIISLPLSQSEIVLGFTIKEEKIVEILSGIGCIIEKQEDSFLVTAPFERLDLTLPQDLIEEIGRIYGYENLPTVEMEKIASVEHDASSQHLDLIRVFLTSKGFSEVYTSSFSSNGKTELENPLASDKKFLRENLANGLIGTLRLNLYNTPLLGLHDYVKIFEIGNVFNQKENLSLIVAVGAEEKTKDTESNLKKNVLNEIIEYLKDEFGISTKPFPTNGRLDVMGKKYIAPMFEFEINQSDLFKPIKNRTTIPMDSFFPKHTRYQKISPYPFVLRDVAVFVPQGVDAEEVEKIIIPNAAGFLVRISLFDTFTKTDEEGHQRTSYAFNLVFQSQEKTLSEHEINEIMKNITDALNSQNGWQVR